MSLFAFLTKCESDERLVIEVLIGYVHGSHMRYSMRDVAHDVTRALTAHGHVLTGALLTGVHARLTDCLDRMTRDDHEKAHILQYAILTRALLHEVRNDG